MNKQEYYREKYKSLNPGWKKCLDIIIEIMDKNTGKETKILDIGCGHADFLKNVYKKTGHVYGVDPDAPALKKNIIIKNKSVGAADALPYPDNFFDIVLLVFVIEHLKYPQKTFREIYRVLKSGGKVIFLTPNAWNYNVWLIRVIPEIFHGILARRLYRRQENDTYPKMYKLNSIGKINKILTQTGFKKKKIIFNGDPSYISFNSLLFKTALLIEKITDNRLLKFTKVHIIGIFQKITNISN